MGRASPLRSYSRKSRGEAIAFAADGMDVAGMLGIVLEFLAQPGELTGRISKSIVFQVALKTVH